MSSTFFTTTSPRAAPNKQKPPPVSDPFRAEDQDFVFSLIKSWKRNRKFHAVVGIDEATFDFMVRSIVKKEQEHKFKEADVQLGLLFALYWIRTGTEWKEMDLIFHHPVQPLIEQGSLWLRTYFTVS